MSRIALAVPTMLKKKGMRSPIGDPPFPRLLRNGAAPETAMMCQGYRLCRAPNLDLDQHHFAPARADAAQHPDVTLQSRLAGA